MSALDKEKILKNSKKTYEELYYKAGRLAKTIEDMNIDETTISKEDIVELTTPPTVDNTLLNNIYSYEDKLYVKIEKHGGLSEEVVCYTDLFLELADTNNKLVELSNTLDELEGAEESKE